MTQSDRAGALTEAARTALSDALRGTAAPEDFLAQASAIVDDAENRLELPTDLSEPAPLSAVTGLMGTEADNGPAVYEYIGALDPSNAADPRLWTFLAFSTYRDYMERRWPLVSQNGWKSRVEDRWLLKGTPTRGKLVRHGIARLWWITNATYDPQLQYPLSQARGDPFAYTRVALQNEDRILAIFDREAGGYPQLVRSVLEHVAGNGTYERGSHIRALMKDLTLVLGFRDLGLLGPAELNELIEDVRPRYEVENLDSSGHADLTGANPHVTEELPDLKALKPTPAYDRLP